MSFNYLTNNNTIRKIFFVAIIICITLLLTETANSQPWKKPRTKIHNQYIHDSLLPVREKVPPPDTIPADRDIEFDLVKLSQIASTQAAGIRGLEKGGLVVLEICIDTTGKPYSFYVRESSEKGLSAPAIEAVRKYAKKYKLKPAIKDGKPVEVEGLLLPIIIDLSIFDKKK